MQYISIKSLKKFQQLPKFDTIKNVDKIENILYSK